MVAIMQGSAAPPAHGRFAAPNLSALGAQSHGLRSKSSTEAAGLCQALPAGAALHGPQLIRTHQGTPRAPHLRPR